MRWSRYYLFTSREDPRDAEVASHRLMARAGMIRKVAAGIYSYLPLGWRSIRKMCDIVRREMERAGSVELTMPSIQPAELWRESGRWERYGHLLLRMQDRQGREFCYGPTHEEVVTDIVRRDVTSYRQLPCNLFQIQTKFRDEIRPRFGLMRGREFIMKDAYSFHTTQESLEEAYEAMRAAYCRIIEACGLDYTMVEADSGTIGGSSSHEFMVLADTGEDAVARCPSCGYGANVEKARAGTLPPPEGDGEGALETVDTPGKTTVADVAALLGVPAQRFVKTLLYETEKEIVAVLVRGDREVNEVKLKNYLDVDHLRLAPEEKVRELTGAPVGFAGPVGLSDDVRVVADESVRALEGFVCGANRADAHHVGVQWDRDVRVSEWADLLLVTAGDPCPRCGTALEIHRGIEVGHIFDLGTKYSETMGCTFDDDQGQARPMIMGCYGLGVGRTVAAAVEQNHDADGIVWPLPLAPFQVELIALNVGDDDVRRESERIYDELTAAGVEVFFDDRDERPGVKFNDADLLGFPLRVVIGGRGLAQGQVELSLRSDREKQPVALADAVSRVRELLAQSST
ncbi:MAG: proline--tRNA ligase [Thermoanaerobaculia bacterium]